MRKSKRFSMMWLITLSFFVFLILAGGCDDKKPDVKDPVDRPTITLVAPADLATDVPINRKIAVTFSEPMEPTTITSSTFTLKKGTTSVSGAVTYTGITATFSPTTDLDGGSEYTVTVTKGVKNLEGIAMAKNYVWSWTTDTYKDTTAPLVSSTVPANLAIDVPYNTKTKVTFSEPMDPLSITTSTFTLKSWKHAYNRLDNLRRFNSDIFT